MSSEYRKAAERFTEGIRDRLADRLHSVVLYGSVARGDADRDSDVDLLVVTDEPEEAFDSTGDLAYEIDWSNEFRTLLMPVELSPDQVKDYLRAGDPFVRDVLEEGEVLYDDGTVSRLRRRLTAARA